MWARHLMPKSDAYTDLPAGLQSLTAWKSFSGVRLSVGNMRMRGVAQNQPFTLMGCRSARLQSSLKLQRRPEVQTDWPRPTSAQHTELISRERGRTCQEQSSTETRDRAQRVARPGIMFSPVLTHVHQRSHTDTGATQLLVV